MSHRLRDKLKPIFSPLRRAGLDRQRFAKRSALLRYSVAAFAVAVALLIKLLLEPLIVQETPFLLVFVAILFSAWYGGLGPGLAATAGAALTIDYFFLPPLYSFTAFDIKAVPLGALSSTEPRRTRSRPKAIGRSCAGAKSAIALLPRPRRMPSL